VGVEGFLRRQQVLSVVIDADRHVQSALLGLNDLHRCYYASQLKRDFQSYCSAFRRRLPEPSLGHAEFVAVFDRLAYSYRTELRGPVSG
jgi:hypothetical protein